MVMYEGDLDQECRTAVITGWGRRKANSYNTTMWFKTESDNVI